MRPARQTEQMGALRSGPAGSRKSPGAPRSPSGKTRRYQPGACRVHAPGWYEWSEGYIFTMILIASSGMPAAKSNALSASWNANWWVISGLTCRVPEAISLMVRGYMFR